MRIIGRPSNEVRSVVIVNKSRRTNKPLVTEKINRKSFASVHAWSVKAVAINNAETQRRTQVWKAYAELDRDARRDLFLDGSMTPRLAIIPTANAGDMISEFTFALTNNLGLKSIASTIHPYPTQAEAVRKVGDLYNKTRLTPRMKSLIETMLKWRR